MNAHTKPPAEPQDASLYFPTPVTPEEAFQAIGRLRKEARDEIDRLIRFLDTTDDYVSRELEEAVDDVPCDTDELEPSLCGITAATLPMCSAGAEDGEMEEGNDEPSLGFLEPTFSIDTLGGGGRRHRPKLITAFVDQTIPQGDSSDREDEHDGREEENEHGEGVGGNGTVDDEPSLCGRADEAGASGSDQDLEGEREDDEPLLGWPENRVSQAAHPGNFDDRELSAPAGERIVKSARRRKPSHDTTDHSGRLVDIDDSVRIGPRKIRNLSPQQENALAPRIDRREVRI